MRRAAVVALALVLASCADNAEPIPSGAAGDDPSVVIVTTAAPSTTAPAFSASSSEAPSTTGAEPTDAPTTEQPEPDDSTTATTTTATTTATTAAPPTDSNTTIVPAPVVGEPVVSAVEVGAFRQPVDLVARPGDTALYVVQQRGQVVRWDRAGDSTTGGSTADVLDLDGRLGGANEQGLLGLAFSPDGGTAYVDFTATDGTTTIAEYAVATDGTFDPASERILLTVDQPYRNHNAGDLAVDDEGLLYVTLGDGGSGGDPERRASDPTSLLGSLLRIDPTPSGDRPYTIPPDNPFAAGPLVLDGGVSIDGAPEVFAWGLRNPWKIAFDPVTDELWIADVGQNEFEEIDVVGPSGDRPAGWGHDFGWSAFEGTSRFNDDVPDTGRMTPPVLTYAHDNGRCSVSGGVPYRGTEIPELAPAYVYGDFCSGEVWALDVAGVRNIPLVSGVGALTAVRADADGEIYLLQGDGTIRRLVPG